MDAPLPAPRGLRGRRGRARARRGRAGRARARARLTKPRRLAAGLLAAAALAARALWLEPRRLVIRPRALRLDGWPSALDGLRVAVVSDLHAGAPHMQPPDLRRVAAALERTDCELVLFLGDFVDDEVAFGDRVEPSAAAGPFARVKAPLGVFGLLGNHDWRHGGERVAAAMRRAGIDIRENEAVRVERAGQALWIAIVGDAASARQDVDGALAQVPAGEPVIVATHSPDVFPAIPDRVLLTLAGHTHSGQVNLPGLRGRWTPSRFGGRYARRVVRERGRTLFVHPGVGTSKLPVRLGATPEVSVLTLRARRRRRRAG